MIHSLKLRDRDWKAKIETDAETKSKHQEEKLSNQVKIVLCFIEISLNESLSSRDRDFCKSVSAFETETLRSQKSVSVLRPRLVNSWWSRPRQGYEQFSRTRPLETGPWMSRLRPRPRALLFLILAVLWYLTRQNCFPFVSIILLKNLHSCVP